MIPNGFRGVPWTQNTLFPSRNTLTIYHKKISKPILGPWEADFWNFEFLSIWGSRFDEKVDGSQLHCAVMFFLEVLCLWKNFECSWYIGLSNALTLVSIRSLEKKVSSIFRKKTGRGLPFKITTFIYKYQDYRL